MAVANRELRLHYQPIVDVMSGQVVELEALLRWQHPTLGLLSPDRFIHIAEETGLILPIGEWVVETAGQQIVAWRKRGFRPVTVTLNVSPRQLYHAEFVDALRRVLTATDADPSWFGLEITETSAMQDPDEAARVLGELRAMGMRIAIDDFGSGYSSLQRLRTLPIDVLKIDRFFIQNVVDDPDNAAIVAAIIALARHFGMRVVAEGVETQAQLDFLRSLKIEVPDTASCDLAQGFLFARPMPPEQLDSLLAAAPAISAMNDSGRGLSVRSA